MNIIAIRRRAQRRTSKLTKTFAYPAHFPQISFRNVLELTTQQHSLLSAFTLLAPGFKKVTIRTSYRYPLLYPVFHNPRSRMHWTTAPHFLSFTRRGKKYETLLVKYEISILGRRPATHIDLLLRSGYFLISFNIHLTKQLTQLVLEGKEGRLKKHTKVDKKQNRMSTVRYFTVVQLIDCMPSWNEDNALSVPGLQFYFLHHFPTW